MEKSLIRKRLWIFIIFTFLLTSFFVFLNADYVNRMNSSGGAALVMLIPTICMLITRLITKEGFKNLWIRPQSKKNAAYILLGWYGIFLIILLGTVLFFICSPFLFVSSPPSMAAVDLQTWEQQKNIYMLNLFIFPALLSIPFGLGEEWGWRGYLLPKLITLYGVVPAILVSGVIWGLWHTPLVIIEYRSLGINPLLGVINYLLICPTLSMIFSFLTLKSKSVLPAAFAHQSYNLYLGAGGLFLAADALSNQTINMPTNFILALLFLVGVFCIMNLRKEEKKGSLCVIAQINEPIQETNLDSDDVTS